MSDKQYMKRYKNIDMLFKIFSKSQQKSYSILKKNKKNSKIIIMIWEETYEKTER